MRTLWGVVLVTTSLVCWGGQTVVWLAPALGVRLGLSEAEEDVEPVFWADVRGEAMWDALTLWTMVAAGVLLLLDAPAWPYLGLVGGGMYLYFAGRGLLTRRAMRLRGYRIGAPSTLKTVYAALAVWGVVAAVTIAAAITELSTA